MADRLTQVQDCVNDLANHMCNAIGILQQSATPVGFNGEGIQVIEQEEQASLFAQLIAKTAKDIEILVDSLPSEEQTREQQIESMRSLETDNQEAAKKLETAVSKGQELLTRTQDALSDIASVQMVMSRSQPNSQRPTKTDVS